MTLLEKEKVPPLLGQYLKKRSKRQTECNTLFFIIHCHPLKIQEICRGQGTQQCTCTYFHSPIEISCQHTQIPAVKEQMHSALQVTHKMLLLQLHLDMKYHTQY